ncbi:hypothetical protein [Microbacterium phyllosphaerae]|uniref:hypothetical protein n=1 Tax=Microbacterium phyllosphaerae TaxID=124798 RepID=UPI003D6470FA
MQLYLVRNPRSRPVWVALQSDSGRLFTYVQNTRKFHLNPALFADFHFDHTMEFDPINAEEAAAAILSGLGFLDERTFSHILKRYRRDLDVISPQAVFGGSLQESAPDRDLNAPLPSDL